MISRGIITSSYGAAYGGLSEVAHPTKSAAENSVVIVSAVHGDMSGRIEQCEMSEKGFAENHRRTAPSILAAVPG